MKKIMLLTAATILISGCTSLGTGTKYTVITPQGKEEYYERKGSPASGVIRGVLNYGAAILSGNPLDIGIAVMNTPLIMNDLNN
ncbi:MAG: hypothetical protein N2745_01510 [Syntrophorhabdaceae bacterium]|nr:hypothetical protein [Syntrophorhabdaceae bacterium]